MSLKSNMFVVFYFFSSHFVFKIISEMQNLISKLNNTYVYFMYKHSLFCLDIINEQKKCRRNIFSDADNDVFWVNEKKKRIV